ncbi:MAG: SprT family zinc-dependent metalloprotease [Rhodospirillaceae bacterium]|nr:SprT family zinc-dependent metalloprotease [Rhodospirillaceae bacterium]
MREISIEGVPAPIEIRTSARARRIRLKIDVRDGAAVLILPPGAALADGVAFARSKADWLAWHLARVPGRTPFADGAVLPLGGRDHIIRHAIGEKGGVWADNGVIHVAGAPDFISRRVTDWLKRRAQAELAAVVFPMAATLGRRVTAIRIGDPRTRWGSCASSGRLAFSWRLVLAPPEVLTYVGAHEVAHLVQMNHSPAFWRVVETLMPDARRWRDWLRRNGGVLRRYG